MYGESVPDPEEFYATRWLTDEDHFGLFPVWPIGTLPEDGQRRLRAHVDRVYFAPEGAADEYVRIPLGSVNDGKAAAEGVVRCIQDGDCEGYEPVHYTLPLCSKVNPQKPWKSRKRQ